MIAEGTRSHAGVDQTRSRILQAARELFERHGTRGTTTRLVAERAGVNEATLFRHFGSKRALLGAMREQACGIEALRAVLATLPGTNPISDLRMLAYHIAEHIAGKRAMLCVSLAEEASGADDVPEWRGPSQLTDDLAAYFAARVAAGELRGEPRFLARAFLGMLFAYVVARRLWETDLPQRSTLDALVDVFVNGVTA